MAERVTFWRCPYHRKRLEGVSGFKKLLIHDGCIHIFTVQNERLLVLSSFGWMDVATLEAVRIEEGGV